MKSTITENIEISVITNYEPQYSSPMQHHYVFSYKVRIVNLGDVTVQLKRRYWKIHDSNSKILEVEGEGVVGQQPILEPGDSHEYVSGCNLKTSMGKMLGYYTFERILDGRLFEAVIPEFSLITPFRLN